MPARRLPRPSQQLQRHSARSICITTGRLRVVHKARRLWGAAVVERGKYFRVRIVVTHHKASDRAKKTVLLTSLHQMRNYLFTALQIELTKMVLECTLGGLVEPLGSDPKLTAQLTRVPRSVEQALMHTQVNGARRFVRGHQGVHQGNKHPLVFRPQRQIRPTTTQPDKPRHGKQGSDSGTQKSTTVKQAMAYLWTKWSSNTA